MSTDEELYNIYLKNEWVQIIIGEIYNEDTMRQITNKSNIPKPSLIIHEGKLAVRGNEGNIICIPNNNNHLWNARHEKNKSNISNESTILYYSLCIDIYI